MNPYNLPSLEQLLTEDFGLRSPTPLQRAIARIADGQSLGDLRGHPHIEQAIGPLPPRCVPLSMLLLCGIRGGKSLIAAAAGVRCGLTCETSMMGPGDMPRVAILATHRDEAKQTFDHLLGAFRTSERLQSLLVREPTDRVIFRHWTGRPVEITVVAGSRAGTSLAARWLAAVIFDEAAKMVGSDEGVVNLDDARQNVAGRLVPSLCASEWLISSPWAPFGPIYEEVVRRHRHSSREMVVVRARGDMMNPLWWTQARIEEIQAKNPDAYRTDFLAEFADPESQLIAGVHIEAATRQTGDIIPEPGDRYEYAAEMDPGTRSNAWTLIVTRMEGHKTVVCLAREWRGSKTVPLSSRNVLAEIAGLLRPYRIQHAEDGHTRIGTDQWAVDQIRELAEPLGLDVIEYPHTRASNDSGYLSLARRFELGEVELPPEPQLLSDLRRLRRLTTAAAVRVDLPQTTDGRHCDYAPALMRAAQRVTYQPTAPDPRPPVAIEQERSLERAKKLYGQRQQQPFWKRARW